MSQLNNINIILNNINEETDKTNNKLNDLKKKNEIAIRVKLNNP